MENRIVADQKFGAIQILDLSTSGTRARAQVELIEAADGAAIDCMLGVESPGADYAAVAGGAVHVRGLDDLSRTEKRRSPDFLGESAGGALYQWTDTGRRRDTLLVILAPTGKTLSQTDPAPIQVIALADRLAVLWAPEEKAVSWLMRDSNAALPTEAERIMSEARKAKRGTLDDPADRAWYQKPALHWAAAATLMLALGTGLVMRNTQSDSHAWDDGTQLRGVRRAPAPGTLTNEGVHYNKSYALVVGINTYPTEKWVNLSYARKDAEGIANYLQTQGFDEVLTLYDEQATKTAILECMQNNLARRVTEDDRVLIFFAGHGHTERLGDKDWGYIVPYDGKESSATYISMEELQTQSEKMGLAKHQLFILDACYGGLLGTRAGGVDETIPNYIQEITKRHARQILTAGGRDQQVVDGGPDSHSVFTGHLLEGLKKGLADSNGDGYITFAELVSYVVPRATNRYQTPGNSIMPGHGLGEFVFRVRADDA